MSERMTELRRRYDETARETGWCPRHNRPHSVAVGYPYDCEYRSRSDAAFDRLKQAILDEGLKERLSTVTRFEVIDGSGRRVVEHGLSSVELAFQDENCTLKVFLAAVRESQDEGGA